MHSFTFKGFETQNHRLLFKYRIVKDSQTWDLVHTLTLPPEANLDLTDPTVERLVFFVGLSLIPYYYSSTFADQILIEAGAVTQAELAFFDLYFKQGLAEFMYTNQIQFEKLPKLVIHSDHQIPAIVTKTTGHGKLVAHGGGKDSIVSGELLAEAGLDFTWFVLGYDGKRLPIILKSIEKSPTQKTIIWDQKSDRQLDDKNFGYQGHKPFNGYLAFLGILVAYVHGLEAFITSNEASASEENVVVNGVAINHQYTKSLIFEQNIRNFLQQYLNVGVDYFSLLRPLSELQIAQRFLKNPKYLQTFMSCNTGIETGEWCADCPKCAFVFLMLASFGDFEAVLAAFKGDNLLLKPELKETYLNLAGLSGHKPFECVGEIEEVQVFLYKLLQKQQPLSITDEFKKFVAKKGDAYFKDLELKYILGNYENCIPEIVYQQVFKKQS